MNIPFEKLTDQQCADIIAHFVNRKMAKQIIVHTPSEDIVVTKKEKNTKASYELEYIASIGPIIGCIL